MPECYGFPMLTAEECVAFFREMSIAAISDEDFKKPEARRWQIFYGTIFELMTGRQADLTAQSLHAGTDCEYSELQEESFALMSFTVSLQQLMTAAAIGDFTVRDLLQPKPKRLLRIVSGAINFIKFCSCQEEVFNKKKDELERKRESYDFVLKENADLKKTLQAKKNTHESIMVKMNQLQEDNDAISFRMQELHKQREVLQRNLSDIKNELCQRNAGNDQIKVTILSTQEEGEKLSQRIVQSPDRVKMELGRGQNRIMSLRNTKEEKHRRLAEIVRQREMMVSEQQNSDQAVRLLRDTSNDFDKVGEQEKEIQRQQEGCQDLQSAKLDLMGKVEGRRQGQATMHEKLSKLDLQYHSKKATMEEHIAQFEQLKQTLHDPRGSNECKKLEVLRKKEVIVKELEDRSRQVEDTMDRVKKLYSELLQQVDRVNIEASNGFSQFKTIMKNADTTVA